MDSYELSSPTKSVARSKEGSELRQSLGFSVNQYPNIAHKIHQVISKNPDLRKPKEIQLIIQFMKDHDLLNQLSQNIDIQFTKNIVLKHAEAIIADQGKIIVEEGNKIQFLYIAVEGSLGRLKGRQNLVQKEEVYQKLSEAANKYFKDIQKQSKQKGLQPQSQIRKQSTSIPKSSFNSQTFKLYQTQGDQQIQKVDHCGVYDRSIGTTYLNTIITTSEVLLLKIPESAFLISLDQVLKTKIKDLEALVHTIPCFSIPIFLQEKQKLTTLIMSLSLKKKKRGDFIYKQSDPSSSFYILKKGNIKLTKQTQLFVQNPNNLYMNRVKLMVEDDKEDKEKRNTQKYQIQESERNIQEAILPYADLRTLYNYHPKKKTIQIGILSPFCLFGEEEYLEKKKRQTNSICNSLEVVYYEIPMKRVEEIIGVKNIPIFREQLKKSSKNKVLYRQSQYANTINFQNKQNLDYFYFEGEKQKEASRKFRITKFNKIMEDKKNEKKNGINKFTTPAQYTTFNFNKMTKSQRFYETQKDELNDTEDFLEAKPSPNELKIMNMTHTWKLMERKVAMQENKSKQISPQRHTMQNCINFRDINKPLIENSFFKKIEREKKRIQKEERVHRLSLGSTRSLKKSRI